MTITLPSGFRIVVDPVLPWETGDRDLMIHCRGAFGPSHVTTRLCLRLMDRHRDRFENEPVLDVGCGTGILALAAARMGAVSCTGLDICRRSVLTAWRNAERNGLQPRTHWVQGSAESIRGRFGWVLANLPFPVLQDLMDDLLRTVTTRGRLLLSGFHDIDWHPLASRLEEAGMVILESLSGDLSFAAEPPSGSYTWMALVAERT